jgi:alpha-tubulin suppressor-like RCC1 family protein
MGILGVDTRAVLRGVIALCAAVTGLALLVAPAASAEEASSVAAGNAHTCVLLDNGTVRCWGDAGLGQLGYGNTVDVGDDESPGSAGPVNLGNGSATEIAAGNNHTCALMDNGTVRCWGAGGSGRLGYAAIGNLGDDEAPASAGNVFLGNNRFATAISAGGSHTCAVLDNGNLRCWGDGGSGQLGRGNTDDIGDDETPGSVPSIDLGFGRTAIDVSAGDRHTCAILDNGRTLCWGWNEFGQLGYPGLDGEFTEEGPFVGDDEMPGAVGPIDFGGGAQATSVSAGRTHTCARFTNSTVRCWGTDTGPTGPDGRLGYGVTTSVPDPAAAAPLNFLAGAADVETKDRHTCARLNNGEVSCWGLNQNGQLGYGLTTATVTAPGGPVDFGPGRTVGSLSVGVQHTCAVLDNADVKCWGFGEGGRLGYGNFDNVGDDETPAMAGAVDVIDTPPTAVNDSHTTNEDYPALPVSVLANDTDPDGGPKQVVSAGDPANGTVQITGGGSGLTYRPDPDYCNSPGGTPDTFSYTITGGSSATVSVTVNCIDEAGPGPGGTGTGTGGGTGTDGGGGTDSGGGASTVDVTAPETTFTSKPKVTTKTTKRRAKLQFAFAADEAGSRFECSFNGARFAGCTSPETVSARPGTHTFEVRATDPAGNVDRTPATFAFEVLKKKKKR